uniref:Spire type actin nucleation factor 2 n=1 Tax=Sus scrofa TaxID=9823 RepID=A0A8D1ZVN4_PIG
MFAKSLPLSTQVAVQFGDHPALFHAWAAYGAPQPRGSWSSISPWVAVAFSSSGWDPGLRLFPSGHPWLCARPLVTVGAPVPQVVQSLGFAIYRALDWGLDEHEERELSPQLERLIDLMANSDCDDSGGGAADEGYGGPEEEEEAEGGPRAVRTFAQAMRLCAARLTEPRGAQAHYQAVCRALFVETLELRAFLARVREAKEMLQKLREDEPQSEKPLVELDSLGRTDWARLWVQLMRELRHGVKLKKVQEQEFNPLPTEFQLTPFEMLMQDIRARNYKLRKVMVDGDIPPRVKKDAHELILDFIRSRPPLKQVSERRLRPLPQKQRTLHEKILEEIKQERRLRPVEGRHRDGRGFGSLPCILNACSGDVKSTSCINLSVTDAGSSAQRPRPRVLLKAPTLAEMEEMTTSEEEESPCGEVTLKRDRSFSEHDLVQLRGEVTSGLQPATQHPAGLELSRPRAGSMHSWRPGGQEPGSFPVSAQTQPDPTSPPRSDLSSAEDRPSASAAPDTTHLWLEFSHPAESLALTVEEVMDVRRVLVKAEMEQFVPNRELLSSLRKGKVCCCCRTKFPLFSWPPTCLFCKRAVCSSCSIKVRLPCGQREVSCGLMGLVQGSQARGGWDSGCAVSCHRNSETLQFLKALVDGPFKKLFLLEFPGGSMGWESGVVTAVTRV